MNAIREPAVAGQFYPNNAGKLGAAVDDYLQRADLGDGRIPKAIIVPHAGFIYSGPVAATAYARLAPVKKIIKKVVLLGPCHRVAVRGIALSGADAFSTPLGDIPIDKVLANKALIFPQVEIFEPTHQMEHSLEVHLPFLQRVLDKFSLVPLVVGQASPGAVAEVLNNLWGTEDTLIVVSSDLSHYLDYDGARELDARTSRAIEGLAPKQITRQAACGRFPIGGLLVAAKQRGMTVENVDLRNSGDTAGHKERVVGYGSWLFFERTEQLRPTQLIWTRAVRNKPSFANSHERKIIPVTGALDFEVTTKALLDKYGFSLVCLAAKSIDHGLNHGDPLPVEINKYADELCQIGASFITLSRNGRLRGCIGTPEAHQPLVCDVAHNAFQAGFKDPRFPPLSISECPDLTLSISVLSPQTAMSFDAEAEFMKQLRPGVDGLVIAEGRNRALFLPAVWKQLPDPSLFVSRLKQKAGLSSDHWSGSFQAWRFIAASTSLDEFEE